MPVRQAAIERVHIVDPSELGIHGIDSIHVVLVPILFSEYSVHSSPDGRMNGIRFTQKKGNCVLWISFSV